MLDAAASYLVEWGTEDWFVLDIELASNTSRAVLYHRFKNKEEIIQRITQDNLGALADKIATNL